MDEVIRRTLLDEYFSLHGRATAKASDRRAQLRHEYEQNLDRVPLSRCPFTDEVFTHSFDGGGLDGLWWQYNLPIRAVVEELPETFFTWTGAMRLADDLAVAPHSCKPGPGVPYVIPRMLLHDDVRAVVSQVAVGAHTGYAIVYYAEPVPPMLQRFNHWGADHYTYETETLADGWDEAREEDATLDFDLARWIESGDLFWIAPGDTSLKLRSTASGCPFLGLEGDRDWVVIENGVREGDGTAASRPRARQRATGAPARRR